jgi:hypothetical protein
MSFTKPTWDSNTSSYIAPLINGPWNDTWNMNQKINNWGGDTSGADYQAGLAAYNNQVNSAPNISQSLANNQMAANGQGFSLDGQGYSGLYTGSPTSWSNSSMLDKTSAASNVANILKSGYGIYAGMKGMELAQTNSDRNWAGMKANYGNQVTLGNNRIDKQKKWYAANNINSDHIQRLDAKRLDNI